VDELLLKGDLSENLWNQLTSLADTKSVSLILSSRRNLMDLVPTEEAKGSDFWRRFALLLPLGCFHTNELADVVKPLVAAGGQCDANALTEILGWTGGVPLLTAALCGQIASETDGKCALKRVHVDRAAEHLDGRCVEMVWRELGAELQNDFAEIARKGADDGLQCGDMDASRANELQSRGLVTQNNGKLRSAVRLLARHAVRVTNPMPELRRHFGTQEKFMSNVQALLDLRLSQVVGLDENLKYRVSQIIRELCHPDIAMEIMRGVFDQTAELVLKADFPGNSLPPAWVTEWEQQGSLNRNDPKKRNREFFEHRVPSSRANRKWLLKLLIEAKPRPRTRLRSATFRLMDQIYEAANYGEHAAEIGEKIPMSFAISACSSVVELCHHLVEDLGKDSAAYAPATK
jgi:hypothetical protein